MSEMFLFTLQSLHWVSQIQNTGRDIHILSQLVS